MAGSFYVPLGTGSWRATPHTAGPWDTTTQHGGPPSALLGRAMRRCQPRPDMMIGRFTCEILRAVRVGELSVQARLARPGRSVELLEASASAQGREVARATAWRVRRAAVEHDHLSSHRATIKGPGNAANARRSRRSERGRHAARASAAVVAEERARGLAPSRRASRCAAACGHPRRGAGTPAVRGTGPRHLRARSS